MTPLLAVTGLSRSFGGLRAVDGLSFESVAGEILGVIGPNGAGKTTAINLISGFIRPSTGRVVFDGRDVTGRSPHVLARLGLIRTFQATTVFGACTVRENMWRGAFRRLDPGWIAGLFGSRCTPRTKTVEDDVERLLDMLGMADHADERASDLPYGLQKTLGLGIALIGRPRLLMLDEPVAGLNADEADQARQVIDAVHRSGVGIMVIDHNMRFMTGLCHRIIVMHHGKQLAGGKPAEVLSDPAVIEAYLGQAESHAAA